MLKKVLTVLKKIILAGFTLFAFNLMVLPLNINIPINIFTIIFTSIFGLISLPFFTIMLVFFFE